MLKETLIKYFKLDGLIDHVTGYVETRIQLMKYEIREEVAEVIAKAIVYFTIGIVAFIFILIGSVTAAILIGEKIGYGLGFTIVTGFYLVVTGGVLLARGSIEHTIEDRLKKALNRKKKNSVNGNG